MEEIQRTIFKFLAEYGIQIVGAFIILGAGAMAARWLSRMAEQWFVKKQIEPPIRMLACKVIYLIVFGLSVVLALEKCGVPIAPMVAGIGVAGVGIGLALQHVLSNLVAGLNIIFTKPFKVGEYIELLGVHGQVTNVQLFTTTLLHTDGSRVVIPNRKIVGEILHNYGKVRQLNLSVGIGYGTNVKEALSVVNQILAQSPRILKQPSPVVGVISLGDFSVNIAVKPWVTVDDYVNAGIEINQAILEQFRAKDIEIPFPQREVRLLNGSEMTPGVSIAIGTNQVGAAS
jgi:small conductance mechanosensitive channel